MNTITLNDGSMFDLRALDSATAPTISVVAASLSKICRYTGHCAHFYSVAQHSVLVSYLVPKELALCGLLHDATEVVLGDVASPLKALLPEYKRLEADVWRLIARDYGLPEVLPDVVHRADARALNLEWSRFMPGPPPTTAGLSPPYVGVDRTLDFAWAAEYSRIIFMARYQELTHA